MARVRWVQTLINRFFKSRGLRYRPLAVDGRRGPMTRHYLRLARYYLGIGPDDARRQDAGINAELIRTLKSPRRRHGDLTVRQNRRRRRRAGERQRARKRRVKAAEATVVKGTSPGHPHWGGARYICARATPIARRHGARLTSTKRSASHPLTIANPGSDHSALATTAYAMDWGTFSGAGLATAIRRSRGNMAPAVGTFEVYFVRVEGRVYRCQTLWAVPAHHDHCHDGARA